MLILVGLGNPGAKYAGNRHNVGFMAIDAIAEQWRFGPERTRFAALTREGEVEGVRCLLMKPQTFYNDSGLAVRQAVNFYKADPADVVLFYDEIDLAPGRFRMKFGGGAAGNNGVRSLTAHIGPGFRRARIGTGHPGDKALVQPHVLSDFAKGDKIWLKTLLDACAEALPILVAGEDEKYQNEVMRLAPSPKLDPRAASRASLAED